MNGYSALRRSCWVSGSIAVIFAMASSGVAGPPNRRGTPSKTNAVKVIDQTLRRPNTERAVSPAHPFGIAHPEAPAELAQFAFLIGEFECRERIRTESGDWLKFRAEWRARYILGGFGIQDEYWTARVYATSLRVFDPAQNRWVVNFFRMPDYASSTWYGNRRDETIVMKRLGFDEDGPTFSEITESGFRWHSGGSDPNWSSVCERKGAAES